MSDAVTLELMRDLLRSQRQVRVCAMGSSMLPSIWPGDELEIQRASGPAVVGQVVAWVRDGRMFIHRVVRVSEDGGTILTQGDRLVAPDSAVDAGEVIGVVMEGTRAGRVVRVAQRLTWRAWLLRAISRVSDKPAAALMRLENWRRGAPSPRGDNFLIV